jgi:hypothetical protein
MKTYRDADPPKPGTALTFGKAGSLIWGSACEALVLAFLIHILGSLAFQMLDGILEKMMPSLPPSLVSEPKSNTETAVTFRFTKTERFSLILAVVFVAVVMRRMIGHSRYAEHRAVAIWDRLREHDWFSLLVINASIASLMAPLVQALEQVAPLKMLWTFMVGILHPAIDAFLNLWPEVTETTIRDLWRWYGANQLRFTFWLLYGAAVCDDLGVPNYKTLGCWFWRRLKKKRKNKSTSPAKTATEVEPT